VTDDLSLYIKQVAWLQATPQKAAGKLASNIKTEADKQSRMQKMEAQGITPQLPQPGIAAHLIDYLFDAGPVGYAGMGPTPLPHSEIAAWQHNTGIELDAWEARAIRRLSQDYLSASRDAEEADCPPFWTNEPEIDRRDTVSNAVRAIFGGRAAAQSAKQRGL
jgi:hypothetical protein